MQPPCHSILGSSATLLAAFLLALSPLPSDGQETAPSDAPGEDLVTVQFLNTPIPVILLEYERYTGKRVIRDSTIQDQTLSIITSGDLSHEEAAQFIERSFLLNGYAILPTDHPDELKFVAYATKRPTTEGLPVITNPFQLPESDQIVTYIMPLTHLSPEAAAELFSTVVDPNSAYGRITPLQNASAVVITEKSSIIRRLLELRDHLDVSLVTTVDRAFQLQRADAEEVVGALNDILELGQTTPGSGGNPSPGRPGDPAQDRPERQERPVDPASGTSPTARGSSSYARPAAPKPRVWAIQRANRVLVMATPTDMEYISNIIEHLDAPVEHSSYLRRKLNYLPVGEFLQIAGDVILRGHRAGDGGAQISGGNRSDGAAQQAGGFGDQDSALSTQTGGRGGARGGGGGSGMLGSAGADQSAPPQSLVIDRTLLVADNIQNMLIASGPPENLRQIEGLIDLMDVRPAQIQISAVIAQLNLGDDFRFGFDFLRSLDTDGTGRPAGAAGSFNSGSSPLLDLSTLTDVNNLIPAPQGLTLYGQINPYTDAFFSALESTNRFKVLSRPTVYTVNNRQATIETGQRVAVPRSTLSSAGLDGNVNNQIITANIDFENVVLRIDVLPLINSDGEITLQIQQRNDEIIGSTRIGNDDIPTIGTQVLGTTVMTRDGGTVLLGGLISEEDRKTESGLPLFTNLPLVGRVFGNTRDRLARQELLIFIQPKIIRDEKDQNAADRDLATRTRVGYSADEFAVGERDNRAAFESQDFNSAEKRVHFIRDLFRRDARGTSDKPQSAPAPLRAVPID